MTARAKQARLKAHIIADGMVLALKGETVAVVGERATTVGPEILIKLRVNLLAINAMWVKRSDITPIGRGTRARVTRPSSVPARQRRKR